MKYNEWIPVSDRLPEEGQIVLAIGVGKRASMCEHYDGIFYRYVDKVDGDRLMSIYYDQMTYWMPLPGEPEPIKQAPYIFGPERTKHPQPENNGKKGTF